MIRQAKYWIQHADGRCEDITNATAEEICDAFLVVNWAKELDAHDAIGDEGIQPGFGVETSKHHLIVKLDLTDPSKGHLELWQADGNLFTRLLGYKQEHIKTIGYLSLNDIPSLFESFLSAPLEFSRLS